MNAARIITLTNSRVLATDQAPKELQAPKRGAIVNVARYGIASLNDRTEVTERTRV